MRKFKFMTIIYLINHHIRFDNPEFWIDDKCITLIEGSTALTLNIDDINKIQTMIYK